MKCERCEELERLLGLKTQFSLSVPLTITEQKILGLLIAREYVTRDMAMVAMYGDRAEAHQPDTERLIDCHIKRIRQKLTRAHGVEIKTKYSLGYYLTPAGRDNAKKLIAQKLVAA